MHLCRWRFLQLTLFFFSLQKPFPLPADSWRAVKDKIMSFSLERKKHILRASCNKQKERAVLSLSGFTVTEHENQEKHWKSTSSSALNRSSDEVERIFKREILWRTFNQLDDETFPLNSLQSEQRKFATHRTAQNRKLKVWAVFGVKIFLWCATLKWLWGTLFACEKTCVVGDWQIWRCHFEGWIVKLHTQIQT